ncbi:MAG: GNAT family N-acetyltransferase [Phycisphaerae bacterium]
MNTDEPVIRAATAEHAETITAFNEALALESEDLRLDHEKVAAGVRAGLADESKARYFLAEQHGRAVGQLMITREWSDWRNGYFWWIQSVFVAPESRGQGVFRALYDHVDSLARSRDDTCGLRLYVHNDNTSAIEVYMKLGMDICAYGLCEVAW